MTVKQRGDSSPPEIILLQTLIIWSIQIALKQVLRKVWKGSEQVDDILQ
jgi:hypothetical protein